MRSIIRIAECCSFRKTTYAPEYMMTSSNGKSFRVTGHWCGEFTGPRWIPCTKASDAELCFFFFDLRPNKRLSKQSWGWWFETPSRPLWRHRSETSNSGTQDVHTYLNFRGDRRAVTCSKDHKQIVGNIYACYNKGEDIWDSSNKNVVEETLHLHHGSLLDPSKPSDAYMRRQTWPSLV